MTHRILSASLLFAAASAACGTQVDSDYSGEPIATLRASVSRDDVAEELPSLEVALVWGGVGEDSVIAAQVSGNFPTEVTLEVQSRRRPTRSAISGTASRSG